MNCWLMEVCRRYASVGNFLNSAFTLSNITKHVPRDFEMDLADFFCVFRFLADKLSDMY